MTSVSDPLYVVVPHLAYYAIRFEDIPPDYIMGGRCICKHVGPVDRIWIEHRFGRGTELRVLDSRFLRCLRCGTKGTARFTVVGRYLVVSEGISHGRWVRDDLAPRR